MKKPDDSLFISQSWLARAARRSQSTIRKWGLEPVKKKGRTIYYDIRAAFAKVRELEGGEHVAHLTEARAELADVQRERIELELSEKQKELVPAHVILESWSDLLVTFRQRMQNLIARIDQLAATGGDVEQMADAVSTEIEKALAELGQFDGVRKMPTGEHVETRH